MIDKTEMVEQLGKREYLLYYGIFVPIVSVSIITLINCNFPPGFLWDNKPFHSTVEAFGALIAVFMMIILFYRIDKFNGSERD